MSQKLAIFISIALTAFVLVIAGAVIGRVSQDTVQAEAAPAAQDPTEPAVDPAAAATLAPDREAAYQALIQQANARLQAAYDQIQAQQAAQATAQSAAQPAAPQAVSTGLTSDQAAALALQTFPGAILLSPPRLVNYQGVTAFEVLLDQGPLYIDAQTGLILYNGVIPPPGTLGAGGPGNRFTVSAGQDTPGRDSSGESHDSHDSHDDHSESSGEDD